MLRGRWAVVAFSSVTLFFPRSRRRSRPGPLSVSVFENCAASWFVKFPICPAHRAELGTFLQPRRKCAHPLHGNWKGKPERGTQRRAAWWILHFGQVSLKS